MHLEMSALLLLVSLRENKPNQTNPFHAIHQYTMWITTAITYGAIGCFPQIVKATKKMPNSCSMTLAPASYLSLVRSAVLCFALDLHRTAVVPCVQWARMCVYKSVREQKKKQTNKNPSAHSYGQLFHCMCWLCVERCVSKTEKMGVVDARTLISHDGCICICMRACWSLSNMEHIIHELALNANGTSLRWKEVSEM